MLLKCCTQYVSKFGKLSNGHMTGKGQSLSQFPRRAVLKNVQTTGQLHSFPLLGRLCSKSSRQASALCELRTFRFSSWVQKRHRNQRSNCQHSLNHTESKRIPQKHLPLFKAREFHKNIYLCLKPLTVWIVTNCGKLFKEMGIPDHLTCLSSEKPV